MASMTRARRRSICKRSKDNRAGLALIYPAPRDLTCVVAAWRDGDDGYFVQPWFFCPKDNLRKRADQDGVPYPKWAEDGFITPTPGNVVDFRIVED